MSPWKRSGPAHRPAPVWVQACDAAIRRAAAAGVPFQAHDLVTGYGLAEPPHHSAWGQRLHIAHARGVIEVAGAVPSTRPETKGSLTRTWRGVGRAGR